MYYIKMDLRTGRKTTVKGGIYEEESPDQKESVAKFCNIKKNV